MALLTLQAANVSTSITPFRADFASSQCGRKHYTFQGCQEHGDAVHEQFLQLEYSVTGAGTHADKCIKQQQPKRPCSGSSVTLGVRSDF